MAPVPWFPSTNPRYGDYATCAAVPREETRLGLTVQHPRFIRLPKVGMTVAPYLLARGDAVIHVSQPNHLPMLRDKYGARYAKAGTPDATTLWGYPGQLATLVKMQGAGTPVPGRVRREKRKMGVTSSFRLAEKRSRRQVGPSLGANQSV